MEIISRLGGKATSLNLIPPFYGGLRDLVDPLIESEFARRRVRIIKYRGTSFSEKEVPFTIGYHGLEVAAGELPEKSFPASSERVFHRHSPVGSDAFLGGGCVDPRP